MASCQGEVLVSSCGLTLGIRDRLSPESQTPSRLRSCRYHVSLAPTSQATELPTPAAGTDGEAPAADPKPVVQLPPAGPLTTGEEEEESVFKTEGTLFEFFKDGQGWRERGRGELRLNKSTTGGGALGQECG